MPARSCGQHCDQHKIGLTHNQIRSAQLHAPTTDNFSPRPFAEFPLDVLSSIILRLAHICSLAKYLKNHGKAPIKGNT